MKISLQHSIALRLLRAVFGCYLLVTTAVTCSQLYLEYSHIQETVVKELSDIANSFEEGLSNVLWNYETDSLQSIVQGMQKIQVISGIKITLADGNVEASTGTFVESPDQIISQTTLESIDKNSTIITLTTEQGSETLYEHKYPIIFHKPSSYKGGSLTLGYGYLYAKQSTVINKVKSSFILILVNALIKTIALWLIFLFFSRKLIIKPLDTLTQATQDLTQGQKGKLATIETMAKSENKDELQLLSSSFLSMQDSIEEKIDNLNALNDFGLILTKIKSRKDLYQEATYLLQRYMNIDYAFVFDRNNDLVWSSQSNNHDALSEEAVANFHNSHEVIYYKAKHAIGYIHQLSDTNKKPNLADDESVLYLPLTELSTNETPQTIWFFGHVKKNCINEDNELTRESLDFLEMIQNISSNTLLNMKQNHIIEEQKSTLERRVEERTKALADANKELKHMAVHDPLTGLANRTLYQDRLEHTVSVATRENGRFSVGCIDLTKFKSINDTYGHDAGDKVLIEVSERLKKTLRSSDTLARMGGDEFALILNNTDTNEAIDIVMQKISEAMEDAIVINDQVSILASANIGIAIFPDDEVDGDLLYKYADVAMYQAKRSSLNYMLYDKMRDTEEKCHVQLLYDLEQGIIQNQLRLHYQPIVDLTTNQPSCLEALVRWQHPEHGLIFPGDFIPQAENTSLIEPLTRWVVRTACQQCLAWHQQGFMVTIAINLSRRILSIPNLAEQLKGVLDEFNLETQWIKLEITETAAMSHPEKAMATINTLKEMGFLLSIDDFGTGQSSLSYLTQLPVHELKIDRSFISSEDKNKMAVIQMVIDLAQVLGLQVVAEGIEDEATLIMLRGKNCDMAQGYHICRPNDPTVIQEWLEGTLSDPEKNNTNPD